jgi:hypothetical protein
MNNSCKTSILQENKGLGISVTPSHSGLGVSHTYDILTPEWLPRNPPGRICILCRWTPWFICLRWRATDLDTDLDCICCISDTRVQTHKSGWHNTAIGYFLENNEKAVCSLAVWRRGLYTEILWRQVALEEWHYLLECCYWTEWERCLMMLISTNYLGSFATPVNSVHRTPNQYYLIAELDSAVPHLLYNVLGFAWTTVIAYVHPC